MKTFGITTVTHLPTNPATNHYNKNGKTFGHFRNTMVTMDYNIVIMPTILYKITLKSFDNISSAQEFMEFSSSYKSSRLREFMDFS